MRNAAQFQIPTVMRPYAAAMESMINTMAAVTPATANRVLPSAALLASSFNSSLASSISDFTRCETFPVANLTSSPMDMSSSCPSDRTSVIWTSPLDGGDPGGRTRDEDRRCQRLALSGVTCRDYPYPRPCNMRGRALPAGCALSHRVLLVGRCGQFVLDQIHDRAVGQRGHVAQRAVLGHVAEQPPHDLAGPRLGQLGHDHDLARLGARAEVLGHVVAQLGDQGLTVVHGAAAQDDERDDGLSGDRVGRAA